MKDTKRFIIISLIIVKTLLSQSVSIHGFVCEYSTEEPIIGVNVFIEGLETGCTTDENGYFTLTDIKAGEYKITFSHIQYENQLQQVDLKGKRIQFLKVKLKKATLQSPEIEVYGKKYGKINTTSNITINIRDIEYLPSIGEPDLFRTIETFPGVTTANDWNLGLYVRGGNRDQNLILLDGMPIFSPYHLSGIFSTFDSDAIQQANMQKTICDARNGNRLSSIFDINMRDGKSDEHSGYLNISMLSSKIRAEGPLPFGSYMVSDK